MKLRQPVATLAGMRRLVPLAGFLFLAIWAAGGRVAYSQTASNQTQTSPAVSGAASSSTSPNSKELDIPGNTQWTDTSVDLVSGQSITITATGTIQLMDGGSPGPQGAGRTWRDLIRSMPVNSAGRGALIGRIGSDDVAQPFLVGAQLKLTVRAPGRLFLGINGPSGDSAQGSFHAKIEISGPGTAAAGSAASSPNGTSSTTANASATGNLTNSSAGGGTAASASAASTTGSTGGAPPSSSGSSVSSTPSSSSESDAALAATLPKSLFAQIPRRVTDKDGNVGDMVNFLLIGSEDQVKNIFKAAGWVQVDRDTKAAVMEALVASFSKEAYLTMPMSQLYLFGRPQDYGFAHAEPVQVVMTRHHLRVWKSTLAVGGQPVWVGAATHDMGLERDQRNGGVTHHIDPNVDDERSFVERSLIQSGYVTQHTRVVPPNPVQDAKTATGGGFHSNGEVLVLWLNNSN